MDISSILLYCTPVLILLLLIPLIIFIVKRKRWKKLDKGKNTCFPIFEEDTPSVMEIEMEELDKWMSNMKKNGNRLSTLEEENKIHMSQRLGGSLMGGGRNSKVQVQHGRRLEGKNGGYNKSCIEKKILYRTKMGYILGLIQEDKQN
ncbi:transmembrane protein 154 [Rhinophrynus dorsalis]